MNPIPKIVSNLYLVKSELQSPYKKSDHIIYYSNTWKKWLNRDHTKQKQVYGYPTY